MCMTDVQVSNSFGHSSSRPCTGEDFLYVCYGLQMASPGRPRGRTWGPGSHTDGCRGNRGPSLELLQRNPSLAEIHLYPLTDEKHMHRINQGLARCKNKEGHPSFPTSKPELFLPAAVHQRKLAVAPDLWAYVVAPWYHFMFSGPSYLF